MVRIFTDIEKLVGAATKLERVLRKLRETPYESLKEEHEEGVSKTMMEKQVAALNNTFINFFRGNVPNSDASSSSSMFGGCHLPTTRPRLNEP
jgi:hypothetical protein